MLKRLLLADDHALMLEGFLRLLCGEFEVVGTVTNGRALLEEAKRLNPDVIVLDVSMPELNGIEAARRLSTTLPSPMCMRLSPPGRWAMWQSSRPPKILWRQSAWL